MLSLTNDSLIHPVTVDHCQLLEVIENVVGISGTALSWFAYLQEWIKNVSFNEYSLWAQRQCGYHKSVLGPVLFTKYLLPLGEIKGELGIIVMLMTHNCTYCFALMIIIIVFLIHFPCDDWDEYMLGLIIINKSEVWTIIYCLGLGHETMLCAVCLSVLLWKYIYHNSLLNDIEFTKT